MAALVGRLSDLYASDFAYTGGLLLVVVLLGTTASLWVRLLA